MDKNASEELRVREGFMAAINLEIEKRKKEPKLIIYDFLYFVLSFVFSRFHLLFGAYPLAVAFLAAAPKRVWVSLLGALVGAISRGKLGIIHSIISIIVVLLRVIISGGEAKSSDNKTTLFKESLILRVSASVIGAFIGAVYEMLLAGFSKTSLLYGISACGFGAVFTLVFYGLFVSDVGFDELIFSKAPVFEIKRRGKEEYLWICFQASFVTLLFFISLALKEYVILGINLSFVFSSFITLFAAKRFGAMKAVVIGFVSSFGVSASLSVAFALLGLGAGFFFSIAPLYAFLAGGAMLAAWSAYAGGLVGFLSVFPEFASAAALFFPLIKTLDREKSATARESADKAASDMITSVALAKRNEDAGVDKLTSSLASMSSMVARFGKSDAEVSYDEMLDSIIKSAKNTCTACEFFDSCKNINPAPCAEIINDLTTNVCKNGRISRQDARFLPEYCQNKEQLFAAFSASAGALIGEKIKTQRLSLISDNLEFITKMINDARLFDDRRWQLDKTLSEKIQSGLYGVGLVDGVAKVFGDRKKNFIIAGEDKTGGVISSKELRVAIEDAAGVVLSRPEFFKRGDIALMSVDSASVFSVDFVSSSSLAPTSDVSGDSVGSFVTDDGYFYSLISDGMGTGAIAKETSLFVYDFMKNVLSSSVSLNTAIGILNAILGNKSGECSATLDLFCLDLLSGEATFLKSGAAHSYVKRGDSLFRIRSETAPLGLMKNVDAEKIRIEIKAGDLVIMFSDGIASSPENSVWLPELLSRDFEGSIQEYSEFILEEAKKNSRAGDDATVSVAKVKMLK